MSDLATHIQQTPLADTHEHLHPECEQHDPGPDILRDLFDGAYITADLVVAGASRDAVQRLVASTDRDIADRFAAVQPAWEHCRHTGYGEGVQRAARLVYGIHELTPTALAGASERNAELRRPGQRLALLRDTANLAYVQLDYATWECPVDPSGPDFFLRDLSWVSFANGEVDAQKIEMATGVAVRSPEDLRAAMAAIFARQAPRAIGVKSQHAYNRTLAWQPRDDADVAPLLECCLAGCELDQAQRVVLGDWCLACGIELAAEHNLPFKLHTGYYAGDSHMPLERTRPAHLCPLLLAYPQARFVLFHTGYPYGPEVRALAKHFPNVYVDFCWAWSIDPPATMDFFRKTIHAVPCNKLFVFGGDAAWPTQTVGYADQCRAWLTHALQAEIKDGLMTEAQAITLASRVMHENQAECFDLVGTRAALTK